MANKISVIIPIYNSEIYLHQCIDSVLNQTYTDLEIILVDDGSNDGSSEICEDYAKQDSRVKVIHKENSGVSDSRNQGMAQATGDWITFIDSDDFLDSNTYRYALSKSNSNTEIICFGLYAYSSNRRDVVDFKDQGDVYHKYLHYPTYMNSVCNKLFRRQILKQQQSTFVSGHKFSEDLIFGFPLTTQTSKITYLTEHLYYYRVNDNSATHGRISEKNLKDDYDTFLMLDKHCKMHKLYPQARRFINYINARSLNAYVYNKVFFNLDEFRNKSVPWNVWTYSFRPDLFITTLAAFLHLDFICKWMLKAKYALH